MSGRVVNRSTSSGRTIFVILGSLMILLLATSQAFAMKVPQGMDRCPSLDACLQLLDKVVPANDDGEGSNGDVLAKDLSRFGPAAKRELLRRAAGTHPGWRNVASAILSEWPTWEASDVPALRKALQMDPGGWLARPLGRIATPEAIEALVEDLPRGENNQTDFALEQLGARAIPYLFPLLKNDKTAASASRVISAMNPIPVSYAAEWVVIASNPDQKMKDRFAALRGIAALGPSAKPACANLHALLAAADSGIRREAGTALHAVHDSSVIMELAQHCQPKAERFESVALDSLLCLRDIAEFGPDGHEAGSYLMSFIGSKNGSERAYAILTLGLIKYKEATPQMEASLKSADWRIVNALVWSLGWLGDRNATAQLDGVASTYWLPEVRQNAARSARALRSLEGHLDTTEWKLKKMEDGTFRDPFGFVVEGTSLRSPVCKSNHWDWKGHKFILSHSTGDASSLRFRKDPMFGELVGTDNGEWGGQLAWLPTKGQPEIIIRDNVLGMEYESDEGVGAIAFLGLAHMGFDFGYALKVSLADDGSIKKEEIARLPGEPTAWTTIGPGLYAVEANTYVVVFSSGEGVLGLASCAANK